MSQSELRAAQRRWAKQYDQIMERMERLQNAVRRLVGANHMLAAALYEISESDLTESGMRSRARRALEEAGHEDAERSAAEASGKAE